MADNKAQQRQPALYRHRFEVVYVGSYFDNMAFLKAMEGLPWKFYWDRIEYQVDEHPKARISLVVETLSDDNAIIGI